MSLFSLSLDDLFEHRYQLGLAITAASVVTYFLFKALFPSKSVYRMPPGPKPWPVVGNLFAMNQHKNMFKYFEELRQEYGDVFTIHLGSKPAVILNSIEAVREAFLKQSVEFAGRPRFFSAELFSEGYRDILFADYSPTWKLQRKICHSAIRKFASGKSLEYMLQKRADELCELLEKEEGKAIDPYKYLTLFVYNFIASMAFAKSFHFEDPTYKYLTTELDAINANLGNGLVADAYPILRFIPTPAVRQLRNFVKHLLAYIGEAVNEHREAYDPDEGPKDFLDLIIEAQKEAQEDENKQGTGVTLTDMHVIQIASDLFLAGTDTSRMTMQWVIGYAVLYPEIQAKMHEEIDRVCGRDNLIGLEHRFKLPYIDAVLHEAMRIRPVAALGVPHATRNDVTFRDYFIPKDTMIMTNAWSLHMNADLWEDPEEFRPERFLDADGQHKPKPDSYLPFSTGKRVCVGEALAKTELLLLTAMIFQNISFEAPPGVEFKLEMLDVGFGCIAKPFDVIPKRRR